MSVLPYTTFSTSDWDRYMNYRPTYPTSVWSSWLSYHTGHLTNIHELGCGSGAGALGILTTTAAEHRGDALKHLILSDPGEANIAEAKRVLSRDLAQPLLNKARLSLHTGRAEDGLPAELAPPASLDLVFACECLHWTNIDEVMPAVAASLRPGATFAAVYYMHIPQVRSSDGVQDALTNLIRGRQRQQQAEAEAKGSGKPLPRGWGQAARGLDFVPFDPLMWEDVRRVYMNIMKGQRWTPPAGIDAASHLDVDSEVREGETAEWIERDSGWERQGCDAKWFRGFLRTLTNSFPDDASLQMEEWDGLEAALQEFGGVVDVYWPATTIMARKK